MDSLSGEGLGLTISAKELKEIAACGTPEGITLLRNEPMDRWVFTIRVLGDETVYQVSPAAPSMSNDAASILILS